MKSRLALRRQPKKPKNKSFLKIIVFLLFIFLAFVIGHLAFSRSWDGKSTLSMAISKSDGSAAVVILNPGASTITTIDIPRETLTNASHEMGQWRMASIWKLGEDEKLNPNFFKTTIAKSFRFPVSHFANESFLGLLNGTPNERLKGLFSPGISDFNLLDRFQSMWFSLFLKNGGMSEIALQKSGYLKKSKLPDGTDGWVIRDDIPLSVASLFVNHDMEDLKVEITDTGKSSAEVNDILNTLGIKVAVINHIDTFTTGQNCQIISNNSKGEKLSKIFECNFKKMPTGDNFDIKIVLTKQFNQSF